MKGNVKFFKVDSETWKSTPRILNKQNIKFSNLTIRYNVTSSILVYYGTMKMILNEEEMYDQEHRPYLWQFTKKLL